MSSKETSASPARLWLGLALLVLVFAGLFALAVVLGRTPPFDLLVTDPLFFKRCLVAHVNLALVAWFYSFLTALLLLLPGRGGGGRLARASVFVAGTGVALMLGGAVVPGAAPLLANYIPTIDHPLFVAGQLVFAAGVLGGLLDAAWSRRSGAPELGVLPESAGVALRAAGAVLVLALVTLALSAAQPPAVADPEVYWELVVWGGGHVLQLVCVLAMLAVWLMLLTPVLGTSPVTARGVRWLCLATIVPWTIAPVFALQGAGSTTYHVGFTRLMQWCIFPTVTIFLILCANALVRGLREGRIDARSFADVRVSAFVVSAALTIVGFGIGAAIRGPNTMVPAHYHASVGAVTVAFMAACYPVLASFGLGLPSLRLRRAAAVQPLLYGGGMLLFAAGFALAGAYGMGRKVYGAEQATRGLAESLGLGLMGAGGLVAIAGGLLFLVVVAMAWWRGAESDQPLTMLGESPWRWRLGTEKSG